MCRAAIESVNHGARKQHFGSNRTSSDVRWSVARRLSVAFGHPDTEPSEAFRDLDLQ